MLETKGEVYEAAGEREIVLSRYFDAPRRMVWEAWTDPGNIGQWWGPKGFTTTTTEMDVRPGGVWRLVMHGPDGTNYPNTIHYTEVIPQERIAYEVSGGREGTPKVHFQATATFEDEDTGTRLTMRMVFGSGEERDRNVREYGSIEGGRQTLERLAGYLADKLADL